MMAVPGFTRADVGVSRVSSIMDPAGPCTTPETAPRTAEEGRQAAPTACRSTLPDSTCPAAPRANGGVSRATGLPPGGGGDDVELGGGVRPSGQGAQPHRRPLRGDEGEHGAGAPRVVAVLPVQ